MWPMSFDPARIFAPEANGTFCMSLPVIIWPGLHLEEDKVEFR